MIRTLQRWLAPWHRWIGLLAGAYLLLIALTGATLLFRIDLQRGLDPHLFTPLSDGPYADPATILAQLEAAYQGGEVAGMDTPTNRRPTTLAYVLQDNRFLTVLLDPASGQVLGELPQRRLIRTLHALHFDLTLGRTGRIINGIGAVALALLGFTGLILWWRGSRRWRQGLTVRRGLGTAGTHRELHSAVGFWTSLALLMWGVTGAAFIFPVTFTNAIGWFSPVESAEPPRLAPRVDQVQTPLAEQIAAAVQAHPQGHIARIVIPGDATVPLQVFFARHSPTRLGETLEAVYVDPWRAEVVAGTTGRTAGEALWGSFSTLHTAGFGGPGMRVLWLLFALSPVVLLATGVTTWWLRRRPGRDP